MWRCPKCGAWVQEAHAECLHCGCKRDRGEDSPHAPVLSDSPASDVASEVDQRAGGVFGPEKVASAIVEVYAAANISEAYLLKDLLGRVGIEARVVGEQLQTAAGALPLGHVTTPRLWVRDDDELRAREAVRRWEAEHQEGSIAPEAAPWECPRCAEEIVGTLEECWSCGSSREGEQDPQFKREEDAASSSSPAPTSAAAAFVLPALKLAILVVIVVPVVALVSSFRASLNHPVVHYNRAIEYYKKGEYDKALASLDKAVSLAPADAPLYAARGLVCCAKGDYEEAIVDAGKATRLDPWAPLGWSIRASAWYEKGEYDRAVEDSSRAIQLDHWDAHARATRGAALCAKGEHDAAIEDFNEAIRLDPNTAWYFYFRGLALHAKGQYEQAVQDYDKTIHLDPTYAVVYLDRGLARWERGDYERALSDLDEAIARFNEALAHHPTDAPSHYYRGRAQQKRGQCRKAIADYDEAIRLAPQRPEAYCARAWVLATCPDPDLRDGHEAVRSAQQARRLLPRPNWDYFDTLAAAYAETGDFPQAVKWQTKAVDLVPDHQEAGCRDRLESYRAGRPCRDQRRK